MTTFKTYGVTTQITENLQKMGITAPTPIQAQAIPKALEDHDILASAQTGTGKTFAYLIPILQKLMSSHEETALIMVPTRELAHQVKDSLIALLNKNPSLYVAVLIGGESMTKQFHQLKRNPNFIVGTPGRINDHLKRKSLKLNNAGYLVLDETDRMLDMGFSEQIEETIQYMPKARQTFMFSATLPASILKIAQKYLNNPERVSVDVEEKLVAKIKQEVLHVPGREKVETLLDELEKRAGSVIIFVKTKIGAEKLANILYDQGHSVDVLHGGLNQRQRNRVTQSFRNDKYRILVATDVAARGLDVPHIRHVINFDLPESPEDYIHRVGRTGRAGEEGSALCLVSPDQNGKWQMINRALNIDGNGADKGRSRDDGRESSDGYAERKPRSRFNGRRDNRNGGHSREGTRDHFKRENRY